METLILNIIMFFGISDFIDSTIPILSRKSKRILLWIGIALLTIQVARIIYKVNG